MAELAPLVTTPDAPVPPGGAAEWFRGARGARLRAALFVPQGPQGRARGSIILSPGRTEPIEKYYETIGDFLERGFVVLAHDWRGQGLSARQLGDRHKGHARGYKPFLEDFQALLRTFADRLPKPWIAVGHSMGGCLTLLAMAHGERRFAAAVLSAPMLGVQTGKIPPKAACAAARLNTWFGRAHRYVQGQPGDPFADDFETNVLTHDRARFARTCGLLAAEPQLALGAPTWGWLDFAFRATAYLARPERLRGITVPVIILSAEDDRLVDNAAQAAAARHLPQGKLIRVPGAYHEILMETDPMRNILLRAFDALTGRAAPKPAEAPKRAEAAPAAPAAPAAATPAPIALAPAAAAAETVKPSAKPASAGKPAAKKPAAAKAASAPAKPAAKPAAAKKPAAKAKAEAKPTPAAKTPAAKTPAAKAPAAKAPAAKKAGPKAAAAKPAAKTSAKAGVNVVKAAAKTPAKAVKAPVAKAAKATTAKAAEKAPAVKAATAKPAPAKAAASKAHTPKTTAPAKRPAAKKPAK